MQNEPIELGTPRREITDGKQFLVYPCGCYAFQDGQQVKILPCSTEHAEGVVEQVTGLLKEAGLSPLRVEWSSVVKH